MLRRPNAGPQKPPSPEAVEKFLASSGKKLADLEEAVTTLLRRRQLRAAVERANGVQAEREKLWAAKKKAEDTLEQALLKAQPGL